MKNSKLSQGFYNQLGFGLVEALVAISVLGVIAVGLISQQKLSTKSTFTTASDTQINNIMRRVIAESGDEATCTKNFGGMNPSATEASATHLTNIVNAAGTKVLLTSDVSNADHILGSAQSNPGNINTKTTTGEVLIKDIKVWRKSSQELMLKVYFNRKESGASGLLSNFQILSPSRELVLNTINDASGFISSCFGDYDMIATAAVETACRGQAAQYIPPTLAFKYGQCVHNNADKTCDPGFYLDTISASNAPGVNQGKMVYTCKPIAGKTAAGTCPAGEYITSFDAGGGVTCAKAFPPTCAPGSVIVKNSSGALVCTVIDCSPNYPIAAFAGFKSDGSVLCNNITTAFSCPADNFATTVTADGTITCSPSSITGGSCPVGYYISAVDANGAIACTKWITVPFTCPAGFGFKNINSNGDPDCQPIERPLACGGTTTHSYSDCAASGGTVYYAGTNSSQCVFTNYGYPSPDAACPGGWNRCASYGSEYSMYCSDTSNTSYCDAYRTFNRVAPAPLGDWNYGNAGKTAVMCYQWTGFPGTGHACYQYNNQYLESLQLQVGCY